MSNSDKYAALNLLAKGPVNWPHHPSPTGTSLSSHCLIAQTTGKRGPSGKVGRIAETPTLGGGDTGLQGALLGAKCGFTQVSAAVGLSGQAGRTGQAHILADLGL